MAYIVINNFKFGLDARRSELSSIQGTLVEAANGHITQGGEFEKRKAFVKVNQADLPAGTFGLEVTSTGLVVFGSAAPSGALVAGTTLYNITGYPNVYYQQLIHPSVLFGNVAPPAMTSVLCSTSFGGNTWAAAQFADGSIFAYENGVAIPAFFNGLVLTGVTTLQAIANQLATYIATLSGFSVGAVTSGGGGSYYFDMWSTAGLDFALTVLASSDNTGTGIITSNVINTFAPGVVGMAATSSFIITGGSFYNGVGTSGITSIKVHDNVSNSDVEILGSAIYFTSGQSQADFATAVSGQIDSFVSGLNISAQSNETTINLTYDIDSGASPNGENFKITTTGDTTLDNTVFNFSGNTMLTNASTCSSIQVTNQVSLIPGGAVYAAGSYVLSAHFAFVNGAKYYWSPGTNDTSLTCGATTLTTKGQFTFATGNTVTLHGSGTSVITATVLAFVEILGATVTSTTVLSTWLAAIAAQVRTFCIANTLPFTAYATATTVTISRTNIDTSLPFGAQANITVSNNVVIGDGQGSNTIAANPIAASMSSSLIALVGTSASAQITCNAIGGVAPYTYNWSPLSVVGAGNKPAYIRLNVGNGFSSSAVGPATITIQAGQPNTNGGLLSGIFTCTVIDSVGAVVTANFTVTISFRG